MSESLCREVKPLLEIFREIVKANPDNEVSTAICQLKDGRLELSEPCFGTEERCPIPQCQNGVKLGDVHNHPSGSTKYSALDILGALQSGDKIKCIVAGDETACYLLDSTLMSEEGQNAIGEQFNRAVRAQQVTGKRTYEEARLFQMLEGYQAVRRCEV